MTDREAQDDELLALSSIFDKDIFTYDKRNCRGICNISVDIPTPFTVTAPMPSPKKTVNENSIESHKVSYLPPIILRFRLPQTYPSKRKPGILIMCSWLSLEQMALLCHKLDDIWEENKGQVVLFLWVQFLQTESLTHLRIADTLDLSLAFPHHRKMYRTGSAAEAKDNAAQSTSFKTYFNAQSKIRWCVTQRRGTSNWKRPFWRHYGCKSDFDRRAIRTCSNMYSSLSIILEYNQMEKEKVFQNTMFSCIVCYAENLGEHCVCFQNCGHLACKECVRTYFEVLVADGNVNSLNCPAEKCSSPALPSQIQALLSPQLFSKYDELLLASTLDSMTDITYCPRTVCQCPVVKEPDSSLAVCPSCQFAFCIYCRMSNHGIEPCRMTQEKENELFIKYTTGSSDTKAALELQFGRRQLQKLVDTRLSKEWLDQNSKDCPQCHAPIEKLSGCNKMTCWRCKAYFCWLCLTILSEENPYKHFNSPGTCFARLFDGDDEEEEELDQAVNRDNNADELEWDPWLEGEEDEEFWELMFEAEQADIQNAEWLN